MDQTSIAAVARASDLMGRAHQVLGLVRNDDPLAKYRISDAITFALSGRKPDDRTGVAAWVHDEYERHGFKPTSVRSVFVPASAFAKALQSRAAYSTSADSALVETTLEAPLFVDALRPRSVALSLGVQTITGLVGDATVPRQQTASGTYWVGESVALTESEGAFDSTPLTLVPQTLGVYGKISRQLLLQGGALLDNILSNDVTQSLASAIDAAILNGSGSGAVPTGIVNASGTNAVSGTTFSYATSVSAVGAVATAGGIINRQNLGWVAPVATAELLAERQKVTGYPSYIWSGNCDTGSVNGHRALSTQNMPAGTAIFGDFSSALLLLWGIAPIELEFSAYGSGFTSGDQQFRALLSANIAIRRPASFAVVTGIT